MFSRLILNCACYRSTKPSTIWRTLALNRRYTSSISHTDETISIPVGGNGSVNLRISRPTQPTKNNNVLVYLPPGSLLESSRRDSQLFNPRILRDAFPDTTIVDLQYRISLRNNHNQTRSLRSHEDQKKDHNKVAPDHRFPIPIHDVFTAWDYITDVLQLYNHDLIDGKKIYYRPRICLVGSHIGGALALSLALTNPNVICAVAVVDALGDWTGLDELAGVEEQDEAEQNQKKRSRSSRKEKSSERERLRLAARELLKLRGRLFRSHSGYFDAFASPVLFLRAPGRDTPVDGGFGLDVASGTGVVMRYGEEVDEVGVIVDGDGAGRAFGPYDDDWQVSGYEEAHRLDEGAREVVMEVSGASKENGGGSLALGDSTATSVFGSPSADASSAGPTLSDQDSVDTSTTLSESPPSTAPSQLRRRKVLRRWPPTAQPEDVLLPYINLFTTIPPLSPSPSSSTSTTTNDHNHDDTHPVDITPVTNLQAQELQDLLRKACFWGREKGFAEERVVMTRLGGDGSGDGIECDGDSSEDASEERDREREREQVFKWLQMRFDGDS